MRIPSQFLERSSFASNRDSMRQTHTWHNGSALNRAHRGIVMGLLILSRSPVRPDLGAANSALDQIDAVRQLVAAPLATRELVGEFVSTQLDGCHKPIRDAAIPHVYDQS